MSATGLNTKTYVIGDSAILSYGMGRLTEYPVEEYRASLARAFRSTPEGYISLDSSPRGQGFTSAGAAWGVQEGLLYISEVRQGDQEQVTFLRLTEKGKEEFWPR